VGLFETVTRKRRDQAWLAMVILQTVAYDRTRFPHTDRELHWNANRIWILEGKTPKATRFVGMSDLIK
jgi:hypothetical protein